MKKLRTFLRAFWFIMSGEWVTYSPETYQSSALLSRFRQKGDAK